MTTENRDQSRRDCLDTLHNMDAALAALRYLDTLLDLAVNADGGALADKHSGLHFLMGRQLESLVDGVELLRSYIRREEKAAAMPPAALPDDMIILPVYYPGIEKDLAEKAKTQQAPDFGQIARDTNVEEATVRRVVRRLLADPRAVMTPEPTAKAVNN